MEVLAKEEKYIEKRKFYLFNFKFLINLENYKLD